MKARHMLVVLVSLLGVVWALAQVLRATGVGINLSVFWLVIFSIIGVSAAVWALAKFFAEAGLAFIPLACATAAAILAPDSGGNYEAAIASSVAAAFVGIGVAGTLACYLRADLSRVGRALKKLSLTPDDTLADDLGGVRPAQKPEPEDQHQLERVEALRCRLAGRAGDPSETGEQ